MLVHLLVRHGPALQWGQVGAEQDGAGPVLLTEDGTVDVVEAISGDQTGPAGGAAETLRGAEERSRPGLSPSSRVRQNPGVRYLQVVHVSLCPHHHFAGRDRLAAAAAGAAVSKQPAETETVKEGVWRRRPRPPRPPSHLM